MTIKKPIILFCIFISLWCNAQNQSDKGIVYDPTQTYSPKLLRSDFLIYRNVLEHVHPGLYIYTSKKQFDRIFDSVYGELNHDMTAIEYRRMLIPIIKASHCEHTYTNTSEIYNSYLKRQAKQFPMSIKIIDRRFYVDHYYGRDGFFKTGDEILEINGKNTETLIKDLLYSEGADGYNETKLWWALAHDFKDKYSDFEEDRGIFFLWVRRAGAKKSEPIIVHGLTKDSIMYYKRIRYAYEVEKPSPLNIKIDSGKSLAVLTVRSFNPGVIQRYGQDFGSFMDSAIWLVSKKSIPNLVIDLRDNTGGSTYLGMSLYSHFSDKLFSYIKTTKQKANRHFKYSQYCDIDTDCFKDSAKFKRTRNGDYVMGENKLMGMAPSKIHYSGKIYVLVNGGTMSAASFFCDIMFLNKRAVFIGDEVGGSYTALNGNPINLTLPSTGVAVSVPTRRFIDAVDSDVFNGYGVKPDYPVKQSVDDFIKGKDVVMDFVINKILNKD